LTLEILHQFFRGGWGIKEVEMGGAVMTAIRGPKPGQGHPGIGEICDGLGQGAFLELGEEMDCTDGGSGQDEQTVEMPTDRPLLLPGQSQVALYPALQAGTTATYIAIIAPREIGLTQ